MNTDIIRSVDPEIARVIEDEAKRQQSHLELIASFKMKVHDITEMGFIIDVKDRDHYFKIYLKLV